MEARGVDGNSRSWQRDAALIGLLWIVAGGIQAWLFAHSEVMAKDGISYVRYAVRLSSEPWPTVLRESEYHPLYPLHILAAKRLTREQAGECEPIRWQRAAQLANLVFGIALAWPMYLLVRSLFGRRVGFWSALAFQLLPVPARTLADALSEGAYLFWCMTALLFGLWAIQGRSWRWFTASGFCGGVAYLARPEAGLVLTCIGFMAAALPLVRPGIMPWRISLLGNAGLAAAALVVMVPFWATIGGLTTKPTARHLLERLTDAPPASRASSGPLIGARFTPGTNDVGAEGVPAWYGLSRVGDELLKSFHYVLWLPLLAAASIFRRRLLATPGAWLLLLTVVANTLLICRLALAAGYVSERHTLLILMCSLPFAVAALFEAAAWWERRSAAAALPYSRESFRHRRWAALAAPAGLVIVLAAAGFQTFKPMHPHRAGHKQAGFWLAERLLPDDEVVDPHGWAAFYSGYVLRHPAKIKPSTPGTTNRYLVREPKDTDTTRLQIIRWSIGDQKPGPPLFIWLQDKAPLLEVSYVPAIQGP